jgi:hypothetical protein
VPKPKRRSETLEDLLAERIPAGTGILEWGESAGVPQRTLLRLRRGLIAKPHLGTVTMLAAALKVDAARVRAAIDASYAAANKS